MSANGRKGDKDGGKIGTERKVNLYIAHEKDTGH